MKTLTGFRAGLPRNFFKVLLCGTVALLWAMPGTANATLGNYPNTAVPLSGNATVIPDAPPINTVRINVSTSTNFKGHLEGDPVTGVVRVTDAHPAGSYAVTVTGFDSSSFATMKTFTLTVTTPTTCNPVTFTAATNFGTGQNPRSVAVGDFNSDGKQDLALVDESSSNVSVLLGDGAGSFSAAANFGVGTNPFAVAIGDFNGDGKEDLAVANAGSDNVSVLLGDGAGSFSAATTFAVGNSPFWVAAGDFNGDATPDLAVANESSNNVSILLGDGAGSFGAATNFGVGVGNGPFAVVVGDFNGDAKQDLAVANVNSNNVSVLLGNGAGAFLAATNFSVGANPRLLAVGDFNGDGNQDLAVANESSNNVSVLLGDGGGSFGVATNFGVGGGNGPFAVAASDFDGDGNQDLATANPNSNNVSVLLGNGAGSFSAATIFSVGSNPTSVAVGDFNGDGKQDLATTNYFSNDISVLLRICPPVFSIDSVAHNEGNIGVTTSYVFTIAKTGSTTLATSVDFTTQDGTATLANNDYQSNAGTLNFLPADTTQTVTVIVNGDIVVEPDETFTVHLSNAVNAAISNPDGTGTIINDDAPIPTPTPTPTATPTATATGTATATPTATPATIPAQALNLSTRLRTDTGNNVGIGGFTITGSAPKHIIIRALGPSLANFGFSTAEVLADPTLEVHGPGAFGTITNDNWRDSQEAQIQADGLAPTNDLESAIDVTLPPGAYTAIIKGNGANPAGICTFEVYDLDTAAASALSNLSTRAFVGTGNNAVIAGFVLGNQQGNDQVVVRGLGPSLAGFGIANTLADPTLELRDENGVLLIANDDWQDNVAQAAQILAAGLAPCNPKESAIAAILSPGLYTVIFTGRNNATGVGTVEVYDRVDWSGVPPPPPPPCPTATATATPIATPTATATATPGPAGTCTENFDGVAAPALPAGWVATNAAGPVPLWVTSSIASDTAPNNAVVKNPPEISDKRLDTPGIAITSASAQLSFRNNFNLEASNGTYRDGGVLEVSSPNINGGAFTDITDPAVGGAFVSGGYTGPISTAFASPIAGRMAWSGSSGGYVDTVVNLGSNVNGQTINLRFRLGTDRAGAGGGWRIDTISIVGGTCP